MISLMLNTFTDYLLVPQRIAGLCLIIVGISLCFLSKRIAKVATKQSQITKDNKVYSGILTAALVLILAGMVVCCF
ncbi:MAG: hypothetical protein E7378_03630 [Clostridiales bacterium]|nr:hypothetical protein [Clostridiales bacterium]